jgi:two-component system LytT family sensor kinase
MVTSKTNEMETLEDIRLIKAKEHVAGIKEFYDSAIRTIMIIAFLAAINSFTGGFPWVVFPAIGMGIGLFFKYLKTYNKQFLLSKKWEEDKITNLMNNEKF